MMAGSASPLMSSADPQKAATNADCGSSRNQHPASCSGRLNVPSTRRQYLLHYSHRYLDFRVPETEGILQLHADAAIGHSTSSVKAGLDWQLPAGATRLSPLWYINLASESEAKYLASRSILLKGVYEVWGEGSTWEQLQAAIESCPAALKAPWSSGKASWRIKVDGWGRVISLKEQVRLINRLAFLRFQGPVSLNYPDTTFLLFVVYPFSPTTGLPDAIPPRLYFGRQVAAVDRTAIHQYALPQRAYLGPTTMDNEMAFLICTQAKVRRGSLVYDPFVGTGSILVAASHLGAVTMGADIDVKVIRDGKQDAQGNDVDIWTNFQRYGLHAPVGLLRSDAHSPPFRDGLEAIFDAIVCDPPYGVRAGGRKSLSASSNAVPDDKPPQPTSLQTSAPPCPPEDTIAPSRPALANGTCSHSHARSTDASPLHSSLSGSSLAASLGRETLSSEQSGIETTQERCLPTSPQNHTLTPPPQPNTPPDQHPSASLPHTHSPGPPTGTTSEPSADRQPHFIATAPYSLAETLADLLHMAARMLRQGGRLVFFIPSPPAPVPVFQPSHPCLQLVADSEQVLTTRYSRRLITMQKVAAFDAQASLEHLDRQQEELDTLDHIHERVFEQRPPGKLSRAERRARKPAFRGKFL